MWGEMLLHQNKQPQQSCNKDQSGAQPPSWPQMHFEMTWMSLNVTVHVWANGSSVCPKHESVRKVCLKAKAVQSSSVPNTDRLLGLIHLVASGWCFRVPSQELRGRLVHWSKQYTAFKQRNLSRGWGKASATPCFMPNHLHISTVRCLSWGCRNCLNCLNCLKMSDV